MKIVTWNCNGAFRKKFDFISSYDADIYIIQECENPQKTNHKRYQNWASNFLWIGDSKNKGLGVFASPELSLEKLSWSNQYEDHSVKYFLPCRINNKINLLAVWTHRNNSPNFGYIGQLWKYLQVNKEIIETDIIAGDFNSNAIWDQWDRWWNHSDVVKELNKIGLESFYHGFFNEKQGQETKPTLYFQRKKEKQYHIDYIFGSRSLQNRILNYEIGSFETWIELSDHMPIFCEIELKTF